MTKQPNYDIRLCQNGYIVTVHAYSESGTMLEPAVYVFSSRTALAGWIADSLAEPCDNAATGCNRADWGMR